MPPGQDQYIVIDRNQTANDKFLLPGFGTTTAPSVTTSGGQLLNIPISQGIVKYRTTTTGTGSAANQPIMVPKPHRVLRWEFIVVVTATGIVDATANTVNLKRIVGNINANPNAQITLFSSNGAQAADSFVFVGGDQWTEDACTYVINFNIPAADSIFTYIEIEYL